MDKKIIVFCGRYRTTKVKIRAKVLDIGIFEIPCLECEGTGIWDYAPHVYPKGHKCTCCKGTGKQYV